MSLAEMEHMDDRVRFRECAGLQLLGMQDASQPINIPHLLLNPQALNERFTVPIFLRGVSRPDCEIQCF